MLILLILATALLVGCTAETSSVPPEYRWASVMGAKLAEQAAGENLNFGIHVDQAMVDAQTPVNIEAKGRVQSGALAFKMLDEDGKEVWNSGSFGAGDFSIQSRYVPVTPGIYRMGAVWERPIPRLPTILFGARCL